MKSASSLIIFLIFIVLVVPAVSITAQADQSVKLKTPPGSLEEWYKPANKRQVWLHTMFKLRREMQAIDEYARQEKSAPMQKWITRLDKDYNKIADMVPEWEREIKPRLLSELEMFAEKGDFIRLGKTLDMIKQTCDDCHKDFQPLVTAIHRSPKYHDIKLKNANGELESFEDNMENLSKSLNQVLIALDDGAKPVALQATDDLSNHLQALGGACSHCHKDDDYPRERILGKETQKRLQTLNKNINEWRVKDSQELMGELAVTVCARCHNTHRILSDLRKTLMPETKN